MNAQEVFDLLAAPFPTESISWRLGSVSEAKKKAMALAYIDARDVMDRFDSVVSPGNWQSEYINAGNGATCCRIGVRVDGEWIWKADGAGQTDVEGDKGQFSDALKRAAVSWGVGRYLYDLKSPWVEYEGEGKFKKFTRESEAELNRVHDDYVKKIGWGGKEARANANCIRLVDSAIRHFVTQPSQVLEFEEANQAVLKGLPKAISTHVMDTLARVGQAAAE